jgi:hypothetical protein
MSEPIQWMLSLTRETDTMNEPPCARVRRGGHPWAWTRRRRGCLRMDSRRLGGEWWQGDGK